MTSADLVAKIKNTATAIALLKYNLEVIRREGATVEEELMSAKMHLESQQAELAAALVTEAEAKKGTK